MGTNLDRSTAARLFQLGAFEQAADIYRELSQEPVSNHGLLVERAACEYQLGNLKLASTLLRRVLDEDPTNDRAIFDYSWIRFKKRDYIEALQGFRSLDKESRFFPRVLSPLTQALINLGEIDEAKELLPKLKAQDEQSGLFAEGRIAELQNRFDDALVAFDRSLRLVDTAGEQTARARAIETQSALASMFMATGGRARALSLWQDCHSRKRSSFAEQLDKAEQFWIRPEKLRSDLEQLLYVSQKQDANLFCDYLDILTSLLGAGECLGPICVKGDRLRQLRAYLNQPVHVFSETHSGAKTLSPKINWDATIEQLSRSSPRYLIVDDLLSDETLVFLQRYCTESVIWYDDRYENGYLGSYVDDGLATDVLLRVADELREALSPVLAGRALSKIWAFKYGANVAGVPPHADFSKWTVNIWLCPNEGNLDPNTGGLRFYDVRAPDGLGFHDYNVNNTKTGNWLSDALAKAEGPTIVSHQCNRAAIFDSSVVHATDSVSFDKRYQYRRINLTYSFGYR